MSKITKILVSAGIFFIEIPEVGLRILCGCPADSVKHMMKRGLIVPVERAGVTSETGPNAILMSDIMVQNGSLANMGEFPVLQMLYRQGMIIPNHPGNTGAKPLLIGSPDQIKGQLNYIYRGNYGLISEQEMIAAGATPERAKALMREKLKFAFGQIRETNDLVDTLAIETGPVEIREGVTVQRIAFNEFEFSYAGEAVRVDLNLASGQHYQSPYPLGVHNIPREYFAVLHSGEGDGWDVNRPSMASMVLFQGRPFVIDAGPNIGFSLDSLGVGVNEIEGIFHTHCHDDHFAGLVHLIRADHRIKYFATSLVRASVMKKLSALLRLPEEAFYDYFDVHDLALDQWNDLGGLEVRPKLSPHPVETSIFEFRALGENGYASYAHFADIASFAVIDSMVTDDDSAPGITAEYCAQVKETYLAPASLKKLDIGGGMIHGDAEDFQEDRSDKIVLAHTAQVLTERQMEIGSGAPYGTVDILIASHQDYIRRSAFQLLHAYFPDIEHEKLNVLLNNEVATFNSETIILREGENSDCIHLVLTGSVNMINTGTGMRSVVSAGALIGEDTVLHDLPSSETFRARSFVNTLRMPVKQYQEFVNQNDLYGEIALLDENKDFLHHVWIFSEALSEAVLNRIARAMELVQFESDEAIPVADGESLWLVRDGQVEWDWGRSYGPTEYFGDGKTLFGDENADGYTASGPAALFRIPLNVLEDIPVVRWKLFETHRRRLVSM